MTSVPTFTLAQATVPVRGRLLRLAVTSAIFIVAYALANQWTAQRTDVGLGVFEFERAIPFVPWTIVPYLSVLGFYVASFFVGDRVGLDRHAARVLINLALSLACYALFPLRFQFERPVPEGVYGTLFQLLGACDLPYNRAPSLHISVLLILWVRLRLFVPARWQGLLHGWLALIGVSVLTTYQHHLIDIPAGLAVGALSLFLTSPAGVSCWVRARGIAGPLGAVLTLFPHAGDIGANRHAMPGGAGAAERYRSMQTAANDSLLAPRAGLTDLRAVPGPAAPL